MEPAVAWEMFASGTQEESMKSLAAAPSARGAVGFEWSSEAGHGVIGDDSPSISHPRISSESHCPFPRIDRELPMLPLCLISFGLKPRAQTAPGNFL